MHDQSQERTIPVLDHAITPVRCGLSRVLGFEIVEVPVLRAYGSASTVIDLLGHRTEYMGLRPSPLEGCIGRGCDRYADMARTIMATPWLYGPIGLTNLEDIVTSMLFVELDVIVRSLGRPDLVIPHRSATIIVVS